ncbi:hypothetical protein D3C72_2016890 [compost metagenome]
MRHPRGRFLGPVNAGLDLRHPLAQRIDALVEPRGILLAGVFLRHGVAPHIARQRHAIGDILVQQAQPGLEVAVVQQIGLVVQKTLHLPPDLHVIHAGILRHRRRIFDGRVHAAFSSARTEPAISWSHDKPFMNCAQRR